MSKYPQPASPLPWSVGSYGGIWDADGDHVCDVISNTSTAKGDFDNEHYGVIAANAYPDLCQALERFTAVIDAVSENNRERTFPPSLMSAYEDARAALAKHGRKQS